MTYNVMPASRLALHFTPRTTPLQTWSFAGLKWIYLKFNGAVVCSVEGVEQIMRIHACICNTHTAYVASIRSFAMVPEGRMLLFTSVREELCVNVLKRLLIYHPAGTFLWKTDPFHKSM